MPLITFSFAFDTESKEAAMAGNVDVLNALNILQQIVIADAVAKVEAARKKAEKPAKGSKEE